MLTNLIKKINQALEANTDYKQMTILTLISAKEVLEAFKLLESGYSETKGLLDNSIINFSDQSQKIQNIIDSFYTDSSITLNQINQAKILCEEIHNQFNAISIMSANITTSESNTKAYRDESLILKDEITQNITNAQSAIENNLNTIQTKINEFSAKFQEFNNLVENKLLSGDIVLSGLKTFSDGIIVNNIESNTNLKINTTPNTGTLLVNEKEIAYKNDLEKLKTVVETNRIYGVRKNDGTRGMVSVMGSPILLSRDLFIDGKKHDFNIVKKIRLLKNAHPYGALMYQEVFCDLTDEIIKYGDIFCNGGVVTSWDKVYTGTLSSPASNANFYRVAIPSGVEIKDVVGGFGTFFGIEKQSDSFWGWGKNLQGALGLGHNNIQFVPTRITIQDGVKIKKMVSRSYGLDNQFCLALLENGEVWGAGYNIEGELGIGNYTNSNLWVKVLLPEGSYALNVWAGNNYVSSCFALVYARSYKIYSWGWNNDSNGCLGINSVENCINIPHNVDLRALDFEITPLTANQIEIYNYCNNDNGWKGNSFIHFKTKGTLLGCGYGGQWALNNNGVTSSKFLELIYNPEIDYIYRPNIYDDKYKFNQVLTSGSSSIIGYVTTDNYLKIWGYGNWGWGDSRAKAINQNAFKFRIDNDYVVGCFKDAYFHDRIWVITTKNLQTHYPFKLYAWGYNELGQLGVGDALNKTIATEVILPPNVYDFMFQAEYLTEGVFLATDGYTLYGSGTSMYWNLPQSSFTLQPIAKVNQFNTGDIHEYL